MTKKEIEIEKEIRKVNVLRIVIILLVITAIAVPASAYLSLNYEMHHVLRQAKNAKVSMHLLQIEYYGSDDTIFDPSRRDGLEKGVQEEIQNVAKTKGSVTVLSWSKSSRDVTKFLYEEGRFRVIYELTGAGNVWTVDFIIPLAKYDSQ